MYETLNTEVFFVLVVLNKASIVFALFSIMKVISVNNLLLKSAGFILTSIILISIFIGALGAFNETNFQRFMTFASLPQIGYVLLGLISNQTSVFVSALAYFCIYILTLLLMYLLMRVVTFKVIYLTDFHALLFYNRPIGLAFISILFSLAGLPPFIGFLAKFILFQALVLANYYSLVILLLLVSIISIIYYLRVIIILATVQPAKQFTSSQIKKELIPNQSTGVVFYALIQMVVILSLVGVNFSYFWFVDFLAQAF